MQDLEDTYERAVRHAGSEYKLAKRLRCSPSLLYGRHAKTLSPELWALIADIAGKDAQAALVAATVAANAQKPRGQWLREALGKSLAVGAVATIAISAISGATEAVASESAEARALYIMTSLAAAFFVGLVARWRGKTSP